MAEYYNEIVSLIMRNLNGLLFVLVCALVNTIQCSDLPVFWETLQETELELEQNDRSSTANNSSNTAEERDSTDNGGGQEMLGFFFTNMSDINKSFSITPSLSWLEGVSVYRNVPATFPEEMDYFFDGLSAVIKLQFTNGQLQVVSKKFESAAQENWSDCIFYGTGTGPTHPETYRNSEVCFENPVVMMLMADSELWITVDTTSWGAVDPFTLDTVSAKLLVNGSETMNAHPACDRVTGQCYVQYPCGNWKPYTDQACFGVLASSYSMDGEANIVVNEISRATIASSKLLQHSHSPCVTQNYVVSKLDEFKVHTPQMNKHGILRYVNQGESSDWLVMDRRTNVSYAYQSDKAFVNNHFMNCFEKDNILVVPTIAASSYYLNAYFKSNLKEIPKWSEMFYTPQQCQITLDSEDPIQCSNLVKIIFDYPTFNPLYKMNPSSEYVYGISIQSTDNSRFFDKLVKINSKTGEILRERVLQDIYFTEANFIPRGEQDMIEHKEDDGVLVSILYNSRENTSLVAVFDAQSLDMIDTYDLEAVIPFHAHGLVCRGLQCYPNP